MVIRVQRHANVSKQTTLFDGVYVCTSKWRVCGRGVNRSVHEGMNDVSNVKVHLKTCSGNINIKDWKHSAHPRILTRVFLFEKKKRWTLDYP